MWQILLAATDCIGIAFGGEPFNRKPQACALGMPLASEIAHACGLRLNEEVIAVSVLRIGA